MSGLVKKVFSVGMLNAGRIASHYVGGDTAGQSSSGVPLHLRGAGVEHGTGKDGELGPRCVQHALLNHRFVLFDAHGQGHVVVLGPAAERMQQEHGVLKSASQQLLPGGLHQQCMSVVNRVAQLEGEHRVAIGIRKALAQLRWRLTIHVETVIKANSVDHHLNR